MQDIKLNTIAEAIEDLKNGKIIIVVDDENRENEGDFLSAAELTTPEIINFMTIHPNTRKTMRPTRARHYGN